MRAGRWTEEEEMASALEAERWRRARTGRLSGDDGGQQEDEREGAGRARHRRLDNLIGCSAAEL